MDAVTNPDTQPDHLITSPQKIHQHVLNAAFSEGYLAGPGVLAAVEAGLALHTSTPKIEAFYQHYLDQHISRKEHAPNVGSDCGSWVDWYGQVVCDAKTLLHVASVESIDPPHGASSNSYACFI